MNNNKTNNKEVFDMSWIQKEVRCWIYQPNQNQNQIYLRGFIKGIIPLSINKSNSKVTGLLQNGMTFQAKAHQLQRCRDSNSIQRDLIQMDVINAPEVLLQLKRRLLESKIHTCLWNSLIITNPFKLIPDQYSQKCLSTYFQYIFFKEEDIRKHEPHIFSFMFEILRNLYKADKTQVICISGQSGSGKTETNKQALRGISYCSSRVQSIQVNKNSTNLQQRILKCDPILEVFGNAKTIKNDNSSRFGKLITLRIDKQTIRIYHSLIKNYFLQKSRIISQSSGERNFHIFYLLLNYSSQQLKSSLFLRHNNIGYKFDDFYYLSQKLEDKQLQSIDKEMWDNLHQSFITLEFSKETIFQIWSIVASILLMGNFKFDQHSHSQNQPCQIKNFELVTCVSTLLGLDKQQFAQSLVTNKRTIAGQLILSPLTAKQCAQGRDSMAKALYENLFQWLVQQLNKKLNIAHGAEGDSQIIKLLDIYGFQVFDNNSFEQLCVNYTNQKIHQIYLQQVFIHEKNTLKKQGLQHIISKLNFTDNIKIIQLIDSYSKSIFNLLDQSCSVNVKDDDFLTNIRKHHDQHEHFPPSNSVNLRKSFIIKHTPGDIQYMAQGFRDKNKDLIREDIVNKLSKSKLRIVSQGFKQKSQTLKLQTNKKFLGVKIRRQVKQLISQMSTNTDLHFIRCIKPNEQRKPFTFVDRVCYNQIKYLGILDTIQMRRESYHIRMPYAKFYQKYGIIENKIENLLQLAEGRKSNNDIKDISMKFVLSYFANYSVDYQFGKERIFLKMATQNIMDTLLKSKTKHIQLGTTLIKAHYRRFLISRRRKQLLPAVRTMQKCIKRYLKNIRAIKRKRAVKIIENAWIKYQDVFFARKKRPKIMNIQKFIRTSLNNYLLKEKIQSVKRAKFLLLSFISANKQAHKIALYQMISTEVKGYLYDKIWDKMILGYKNRIDAYFKGALVIKNNKKAITKAQQATNYRLIIKYKQYIQKYTYCYLQYAKTKRKLKAISTIQSFFRMFRHRNNYLSLRNNIIKIQRNWKKYYYDRQFNLKFTEKYFKNGIQGSSSNILQEVQFWKKILFRDLGESSKQKQKGVESLLYANEKAKIQKMGLFYYMLDFEILTDLSAIYPNYSWIQNYFTLYQQCWQKGNPIQMLQVSDEHTVCATLSKVYQWGNYKLQDFLQKDENKFKIIKAIKTPSNKIEKIHAHNKFTIVQIENQEPIIYGNQEFYHQDSSNKEWKTLNQSYVLLNGLVLTLKKAQFSKIQLSQKVVQLSCGMYHCIAKTSLKKVYCWGDNSKGQLGLGHFKRVKKPKILQYIAKHAISVQQVVATAYGNMILDTNSRLYWWGTNGTIQQVCTPRQCHLYEKSQFLDSPQKYTVVRIVSTWSKSLSIIGITLASHNNIFKSSQINIKKKTFQNLISKWNSDIKTIYPPYIQTIAGYFQQKFMIKANLIQNRNSIKENQRIRQKLLAQINLMQETERTLLKQRKRF